MSVGLSALHEFTFQVVHLVDELLAHGLAQRIALAAGEVGEQTAQKHDLLLIDRDTVCVFQILLHHRYIIYDRAFAVFSVDEVGDIVHRSRTIQCVHGY